jgi:hypothetical protein
MSDQEPHEPRVGIFWLYNGKLITNSTPLPEAEPFALSCGNPSFGSDRDSMCSGILTVHMAPFARSIRSSSTPLWSGESFASV